MELLDRLFGLNGRTALVPGTVICLGRMIAKAYAQAGARVICADIFRDRVDGPVAASKPSAGNAQGCKLDVWNEEWVVVAAGALGCRSSTFESISRSLPCHRS